VQVKSLIAYKFSLIYVFFIKDFIFITNWLLSLFLFEGISDWMAYPIGFIYMLAALCFEPTSTSPLPRKVIESFCRWLA